ncbi:uncharacterized protein [Blastocystis hominis]|uniref:Pyridoxamine kinase/Phosphomethylpyrimidine kinase domain-containing protein n=1 Tax=Blastocystis hominis TaxID=12968 RepID=D8M271_BLAHO|nr:uncharacterized protein [Blastocystis hominis]CBK22160.2 unnamed protein product [Blastocystis hominis]|eukprot:XP_012896208.1 uncharacterized protein [Blastocystis hominis]
MASIAEQLWEKYLPDAYCSLYNPWVVGIATGKLPKAAWLDYLQQDTFYLSIYEKAYFRVIELCKERGDDYHREICEAINSVVRRELDSHVKKTNESGEAMEEFKAKKATRDYTDLVVNAYTNGCLSEIVTALCPCNKLYDFIGHEIAAIFPDHNHAYSDWIRIYASEDLTRSSDQLYEMMSSFPAPADPNSLEHYFSEAMRLEYEFFDQQDHVPPLFTAKFIQFVGVGNAQPSEWEHSPEYKHRIETLFQEDVSLEKLLEALRAAPETPAGTVESAASRRFLSLSRDSGKVVKPLTELCSASIPSNSLGFGSFAELPALLGRFAIAVLMQPSEAERSLLQRCGVEVRRLLWVFQFDPASLPKNVVYYVENPAELGMTLCGNAYYPRQHVPHIPTVLAIAGNDSCGGAGIPADIKTATMLGVYSAPCITAVTVQNSRGVSKIVMMTGACVEEQISWVCDDIHVDAVKIGMTGSLDVIRAITAGIRKFQFRNVVLDPVMVATSGDKLTSGDICECLKNELLPLCTIVTPNLPETSLLLGRTVSGNVEEMKTAARELGQLGCPYVLVKGGHMEGEQAVDVLYSRESDDFCEFSDWVVYTGNNHGTGCTLSSAIAANLAKGLPMREAVKNAKKYVHDVLEGSRFLRIGRGVQGLMNHMCTQYLYE